MDKLDCLAHYPYVVMRYLGVETALKAGSVGAITLVEFRARLDRYLGIETHKTLRLNMLTAARKQTRQDPAKRAKENAVRRVGSDPQRASNRQAVGQYFAKRFDDPSLAGMGGGQWHKDLIPVINRALRTPKLKAASLVATLERDYNQMGKLWDERQRRRRNLRRVPDALNEIGKPVDGSVYDDLW